MTSHNTSLTIIATVIRRDAEGRFCLNDCHKASGAEKKNGPSYWLDTEQAKALVAELTDTENPVSPVLSVRGGRNQGTYVAKELVYAYAMWISPAFHLRVIRAFDAMVHGGSEKLPAPRKRKPAFDVAFRRCLNVAALLPDVDESQRALIAARGTFELTGVNPLELMGVTSLPAPTQDVFQTPTELGKTLGLTARAVNQLLLKAGLQLHADASANGSDWKMTDLGRRFGRMFDTTRKHGKGSQQQLKWRPATVEELRPFAKTPEPAS